MGIDKHLRIDLEMVFGLRVDVRGGHDRSDRLAIAQQDTAAFFRMCGCRLDEEADDDIA